jgi:hypothetical protein
MGGRGRLEGVGGWYTTEEAKLEGDERDVGEGGVEVLGGDEREDEVEEYERLEEKLVGEEEEEP